MFIVEAGSLNTLHIEGAAVAEWWSSWLAEQEDRGSIPGLATWIFRDWLSPASKSRYGWKIAKSTLILKTTNQQPTLHIEMFSALLSSDVTSLLKFNSKYRSNQLLEKNITIKYFTMMISLIEYFRTINKFCSNSFCFLYTCRLIAAWR